MKKFAYLLLLLFMAVPCFSQVAVDSVTIKRIVNYNSYNVGNIADDTTYWFKIKGKDPVSVFVDFTYFDQDDATVDFYKGSIANDSIYYNSIDGLIAGVSFPLTLVRATYLKTHESDTMYVFGITQTEWPEDLLGVHLDPGTVGSKQFNILINR